MTAANATTVLPWTAVIFMCVCFACIGAAWGGSRTSRYENARYRRLVADDASQRTAIRDLYEAEGYAPPVFYDELEHVPPALWERLWRRLRGERGEDAETPAEDTYEPDPAPSTQPIRIPPPQGEPTVPDMKAASQVQPLPAATYEQWKAEQDARFARDMAAIRGTL